MNKAVHKTIEVIFCKAFQKHTIGSISKVAFGYANNYLIPQKIAIYAKNNKEKWELQKNTLIAEDKVLRQEMQTLCDKLNGSTITIQRHASQDGALYGSVTTKDILNAINTNKKLYPTNLHIPMIKHLGTYFATFKPYNDISAKIEIKVDRI